MISAAMLATALFGYDGVKWKDLPGGRFLFFAVLEGLYEDGVTTEQASRLLMTSAKSGDDRGPEKFVYLHFIPCCPLCDAAIDALRTYRSRPKFHWHGDHTIGIGLDPETAKALASDSRTVRLDAVEKLIRKWAKRRFERLKLSDEERAKLADSMSYGRKLGMASLPGAQANGYLRKGCAACDAAYGACAVPK